MKKQLKRITERILTLLLAVILLASPVCLGTVRADEGGQQPAEGFEDVDSSAWYYDAVEYVASHGLINGVGESRFDPEGGLTRAMAAQILYNLEGSTETAGSAPFSDVGTESWYADAVAWAAGAGIVNGYEDGTFRPENLITRQDLLTVMYRYTVKFDEVTTEPVPLDGFADKDSVAGYAREAVEWAVGAGIVKGTVSADGTVTLQPGVTATRAQIAAMVCRYHEDIVEAEAEKPAPTPGVLTYTHNVIFKNTDSISAVIDEKPVDRVSVRSGETIRFTVNVQEGVTLSAVIANDEVLTPDANGVYSLTVYNTTVVTFQTAAVYTVSFEGEHAKVYIDGKSDPVESVSAEVWETVSFTVVPDEGYDLVAVTADGKELKAERGVYSVTVNKNLTVEILTVGGDLPPAGNDYTITLESLPSENGEKLKFYKNGAEIPDNKIVIKAGEKYVTFNAKSEAYHPDPNDVSVNPAGAAKATVVQNIIMVSHVTSNCTVTVKPKINQYTVTFHYKNDDVYFLKKNPVTVTHGQTVSAPADEPESERHTTLSQYKIYDWYRKYTKNGDVEVFDDEDKFDFETPVTSDLDLYGKWEDRRVTVTFADSENPSTVYDNLTLHLKYGDTAKKPDTPPEKNGCEFAGWFQDQACTLPFKFSQKITEEEKTIYALWFKTGETPDCVYLGGENASNSNTGFSSALPVATFEAAKSQVVKTTSKEIHIVSPIVVNNEVTWDLSNVTQEGETTTPALVLDPLVRVQPEGGYVGVQVEDGGKLTLQNITFKGFTKKDDDSDDSQNVYEGRFFDIEEGGTVTLGAHAVLTDSMTSTVGPACVSLNGGTFIMKNESEISNIEKRTDIEGNTATNNGVITLYNFPSSKFIMEGGTIRNCYAIQDVTGNLNIDAAVVRIWNGTAIFKGGTIEECGYDPNSKDEKKEPTSKYIIQDGGSAGTIFYEGTVFMNNKADNAIISSKNGSRIVKGTFGEPNYIGNMFWLESGGSSSFAAILDPTASSESVGDTEKAAMPIEEADEEAPSSGITINGDIYEKNTTKDATLATSVALDTIDGSYKIQLEKVREGTKILEGTDSYPVTETDFERISFPDEGKNLYTPEFEIDEDGKMGVVLEKTVKTVKTVFLSASGKDENDGLSESKPVLTMDRAHNVLKAQFDLYKNSEKAQSGAYFDIEVIGTSTLKVTDTENWDFSDIPNARIVRGNRSSQTLFTIGENKGEIKAGNVTINNVTIDGNGRYGSSTNPFFQVKFGTLTLEDNAVIQYCGNESSCANYGSAVDVRCGASVINNTGEATFTMNGGEIKNCYAKNFGAAVALGGHNSKFVMNGGIISNCTLTGVNSTTNDVRGIAIGENVIAKSSSHIELNGGTIRDNSVINGEVVASDVAFGNAVPADGFAHTMKISADVSIAGEILLKNGMPITIDDPISGMSEKLKIRVAGATSVTPPDDGAPVLIGGINNTVGQGDLNQLECMNKGEGYNFVLESGKVVIRKAQS